MKIRVTLYCGGIHYWDKWRNVFFSDLMLQFCCEPMHSTLQNVHAHVYIIEKKLKNSDEKVKKLVMSYFLSQYRIPPQLHQNFDYLYIFWYINVMHTCTFCLFIDMQSLLRSVLDVQRSDVRGLAVIQISVTIVNSTGIQTKHVMLPELRGPPLI